MKASSHGDNLIQLTRLGSINSYLVREADGFTLVDTGPSRLGEGPVGRSR